MLFCASRRWFCSTKDFCLPQHRERVWMIFLKRPSLATSDAALDETAAKLRATLQTAQRFMVPTPEPLTKMLTRLGSTAFAEEKAAAEHPPVSKKTREDLKRYAQKQKLSLRKADEDAFKQTVGKTWSSRAADSCYTKLVEAQKKHG